MKIAKHQTVGWWIEQLQQWPKDWPVIVATWPELVPLFMLSDYGIVQKVKGKDTDMLCIDVGPLD